MRTVFLHGEVELFDEAVETMTEQFTKWCAERGAADEGNWLVGFLLREKWTRDGLLALWTADDLRSFLTESAPRDLILDGGWSSVPGFLHRWLDFLQANELLMTGSDPLPQLHSAVDEATGTYLAAMAESSEWSSAKSWSVTLREHGIDPDDGAALEEFVEAVGEGEILVDDAVVDALDDTDTGDSGGDAAFWLPPLATARTRAAAEADPSEASALSHMAALRDWIGTGRFVDNDELGESDLDELAALTTGDRANAELLLEWARQVGLVRTAGEHLVTTQISAGLLQQRDLLWTRLWESVVLLDDVMGADQLGDTDVFPELIKSALCALYTRSTAVDLDDLADMATEAISEHTGEPAVHETVHSVLANVIDQWEELAAVRQFTPEQDPTEPESETTLVELLPLGVRAAQESLRAFGFTTPTADELAAYPGEVVALAIANADHAADDAAHAWIARRGNAEASGELESLLRTVDNPAVRITTWWLLEHLGEHGVAAARRLVDDPVAGPSARMWLPEAEPSAEDELLVAVDGMAVAASDDPELFLAEFQQRPVDEQLTLIGQLCLTDHRHVDAVLGVLATGHPDAEVAAAAHRAAAVEDADE